MNAFEKRDRKRKNCVRNSEPGQRRRPGAKKAKDMETKTPGIRTLERVADTEIVVLTRHLPMNRVVVIQGDMEDLEGAKAVQCLRPHLPLRQSQIVNPRKQRKR